jgi:hypothetical protein
MEKKLCELSYIEAGIWVGHESVRRFNVLLLLKKTFLRMMTSSLMLMKRESTVDKKSPSLKIER